MHTTGRFGARSSPPEIPSQPPCAHSGPSVSPSGGWSCCCAHLTQHASDLTRGRVYNTPPRRLPGLAGGPETFPLGVGVCSLNSRREPGRSTVQGACWCPSVTGRTDVLQVQPPDLNSPHSHRDGRLDEGETHSLHWALSSTMG